MRIIDPNEEARERQEAARERIKVKRQVREERKEYREVLAHSLELAKKALEAYDRETEELLERFPRIQAAREERKEAIREYNDAIDEGSEIINAADPRPGKMGRDAELAQDRIVSAYLVLEDFHGEITEMDEHNMN